MAVLGYFSPTTYEKAKAPVACPEGNEELNRPVLPHGLSLFTANFMRAHVRVAPATEDVESFADSLSFSSPKEYIPRRIMDATSLEPISVNPVITLSIQVEDRSSLILLDIYSSKFSAVTIQEHRRTVPQTRTRILFLMSLEFYYNKPEKSSCFSFKESKLSYQFS